MSQDVAEASEGQITTPLGSLTYKGKRMAEFISILSMCGLVLLGYILWQHKEDAKGMQSIFAQGFKEMHQAQTEQNRILREQVCLLSLPEQKREREFLTDNSLCKRISRERQ
jgi:hypothetical protein